MARVLVWVLVVSALMPWLWVGCRRGDSDEKVPAPSSGAKAVQGHPASPPVRVQVAPTPQAAPQPVYQTPPAIAAGDRWFAEQLAREQQAQARAQQAEARQWQEAREKEAQEMWRLRDPEGYKEAQWAREQALRAQYRQQLQQQAAQTPCQYCQGCGTQDCPFCAYGTEWTASADGSVAVDTKVRCKTCGGTGRVLCNFCNGTGHMVL